MKTNEPFNVLATNSWSRVPRATVIGNAIFAALGQQALGATVIFQLGAFKLTLATAVGYLVTTAITSWAMKAMAPKPSSFNNQSQGILVNSRSTAAPQDFVYGKVRKGGTVTFYETTGSNNRYLHQIISLAGHEVNDIGDIYINDEVVTVDSDGFVTGDTWKSKIRIYKHLGDQTSASDDFANVTGKNLANTLHTYTSTDSNFVGKGIAYLYVRYEYDRDVFGSGVPLVTAVVEGKKVYDPRNSTTAYSNNAALCLRDFLLSKYGLNDSAIDDTFLQAAANECDETVSLSGSGSESRYTVNGVVRADEPIGSVLEDMTAAMAGTLYWGQGQWKIKAGAYSTPVEDFGLDDLRGPIQLDTRLTMRDNFNKVAGTFIDADSRWITADYPQVLAQTDAGSFATDQVYTITELGTTDFTIIGAASNAVGVTFTATGAGSGTGKASAFLGEDNGEESILDLPFTFVTSAATAQRLAKLTLLRAREQMTFSATFSMKAFEVEVGDIIRLTNDRYGWTNKTFEVVGWSLFVDGDDGALKVNLTLRETSAAAFDWNAEESAITSNNTTLPSFDAVATVDNLTASNTGFIDGDGNFVPRISLDWADVGSGFHDHFEVHHKLSSESTYQTFNVTESRATLLGYAKDAVVNYRVRAVNQLGVRGEFSPDPVTTITVTGDDTAPTAPTSFTTTGIFAGVSLAWTNPSAPDLDVIEVYRNTTNSSSTATQVAEVRGDSFTDDGLPVNTTYFYWLKAKDRTGNTSGFSAGQSAVTTYVTESNLDPTYTNSVDTAAVSAAAAQAAQTAAETAETNAETAQTAAETARTAAQTAQTAAETAKAGAETAETNSETAKTAAETAKTAAETAETNAESSATAASTSASNASTSETNAASSATAAAASATTASTKASEASTSATNAATAETNAETAESNAQTYASNASTSATDAATSATNAATSETNAATSATGAASSATTATTKASEASTSAANAATSESNATISETNAATSESNASTSETNAATSETNAATSATNASNSATTATTKASDAASSATAAAASASTATTKASEASTSASQAATSATNASGSASSAATSATTAATSATNAEDAYESITLTNILSDGDFENGTPSADTDLVQSTAYAKFGSKSGKLTNTNANPDILRWANSDIPFTYSSGDKFTWGFWVYNNTGSSFTHEFGIAGDGGWAKKTVTITAGSWQFVQASGTGGSYPETGDFRLELRGTPSSSNIYFDGVILVRGEHDLETIAVDSTASDEAANAGRSASAASTSATSAATSATSASQSASTATTQASTATTKASEAATSATSAATSASNASGSASSASTSASDAATSESNAAGSASAASTSASTASTSATNASNSASASATSATQAATSATSASTSASTATTKASEASTSATSAATSATNADTSALNATRTATRQAKLNHAAGMLAPQICLKAASYKFAVWEDDTTIYKNGVELVTLDRGSRTSWTQTLALGDRLTSSKPFYAVSVSADPYTIPLASEAMADTRFYFLANRYNTQTVNIYSLADGNAKYTWSSTHDSGTPVGDAGITATDITLTAGTVTTLNPVHSSGTMYFNISSDVPILIVKYGAGGDGALLMPPSESIFQRQANPVQWVDTGSASSSHVDSVWYSSSDGVRRMAAFATADGSGGDAEGHIGIEALGDEYVLPCTRVNNIWLMSPEECVVTVKNQEGTVEATFNLTGSADQETGSSQGSGGALYGSQGPYYLSGTKPFALQAQMDAFADEEMHYGFRRDLKPRYGTEAVTEILQSSVTDLEGNQEAAIVMRAKAGTGGAQLELVAGDNVDGGSVSTARIDADNIILDGTVTANQIAAEAITANEIAAGAITTGKIESGAVTSNEIEAGSIITSNISSGAVAEANLAPNAVGSALINMNSPLNFGEPTSAILGGRESLSDFSTAGFYIGRTSSDGTNADGFQLSHTSTNVEGNVQGIVHDSSGFNVFEPTFRLKSGTSTPNTVLTTQGQTVSLAYGQVHTISVIGGGGGGGGASNETSTKAGTYHGTAGSSGGSTTVTLTGASGYTGTTSWTASGGLGGARGEDNTNHWNRGGGYTPNGPSGDSAGYGDGGAGGDGVLITLGTDRNGNSGAAPSSTSYGAGGGGGAPASNTNVNEVWWGNAGGAGGAGQVLTVEIDLTSATTNGTLTLTARGSGGFGGAGYGPLSNTTSGSGGSGANGALVVVSELDGYTALSVSDLRFTFLQSDHSISISSFTDNGTNHTVYGPFTEDRFVEMSGSYRGAYSWNTNDRWGLKVYASTSAVANRAYIISISGSSSATSQTTSSSVTGSTNLSTGNAGSNGIFFGYATLNRAYSTLTFSVKLFLPAGATIRQVGEWNGVRPTNIGISGGAWIV